ncbi:PadR family transcriptional regulator [Mobilisporobacter senegalensis]
MILYMLLDHESYGYEISKNIKEISNEKYIMKETTLYSAFNRLEKNGFIESFYKDETFGKRRTYYRITKTGLDYYKEKCEEWKLTKEVVNQFIREV